jgi:hypothetical protein
MAGAYAHLTMVNMLRATKHIENRLKFSNPAAAALLTHLRFCELGAVSPDYPYLVLHDEGAAKWADTMHWTRVGEVLKAGVAAVGAMDGEGRNKAFAWLLGYASHVATDVTIHPMVNLKVGPYAQNKTAHRRCEMNQDAHIWQRMNLGNVGLSEHLRSGMSRCATGGAVDAAVKATWEGMLRTVHADEFARNAPKIDKWHAAFDLMVDKIGEEGNRLMPIARHVGVDCGLTYPLVTEIEQTYIRDLRVPGNKSMDYDDIFDHAMESVSGVWVAIEAAVFRGNQAMLASIGNWNLDTGQDGSGRFAFWS